MLVKHFKTSSENMLVKYFKTSSKNMIAKYFKASSENMTKFLDPTRVQDVGKC